MLADQGATVIEIQNHASASGDKFDLMCRGKHKIALNLKNSSEKEFLLKDIIPHIDVLLESYRPGVMEKLGLSPQEVHKINPKVIFVRLSGFGQVESKYKERAGHDINYLAITGILNRFKR